MKKTTLLFLAAGAICTLPAASPVAYTITPNSTISIFNPAGSELGAAGMIGAGHSILFTLDGKTAWVAGQDDLFAIDVKTKAIKSKLAIQTGFTPVLSPDGARIYVPVAAGVIAVDPSAGVQVGAADVGPVQDISVSPDSKTLYAISQSEVFTINATTLATSNQYSISGIAQIASLPDNKTAVIGVQGGLGSLLFMDLATGSTRSFYGNIYEPFILSTDGKYLLRYKAQELTAINISTGQARGIFVEPIVNSMCVAADTETVYAATASGLSTIDIKAVIVVNAVAGASPTACAVTPDSSRVWMTNGAADQIAVLNPMTGKLSGVIEAPPVADQMALTKDGSKTVCRFWGLDFQPRRHCGSRYRQRFIFAAKPRSFPHRLGSVPGWRQSHSREESEYLGLVRD